MSGDRMNVLEHMLLGCCEVSDDRMGMQGILW